MDENGNPTPEQTPPANGSYGNAAMNQLGNIGNKIPRGASFFNFNVLFFPKIANVLWILFMILVVLAALVMVIGSFTQSATQGLVALVIAPFGICFYLLMIRIWFEFMVVAFKINDGIQELVDKTK